MEPPRAIYAEFTWEATTETVANLPKNKSIAWTVQRQKFIESAPATLKDIAIPIQLTLSIRGDNFLVYDSGTDDADYMLIISTEEKLDVVESNTTWHADGTLKSCPTLFYQVFTTHAIVNEQTVPMVYFLLTQKTEE